LYLWAARPSTSATQRVQGRDLAARDVEHQAAVSQDRAVADGQRGNAGATRCAAVV
jgi:hypothetical protein